jgi:hypothetical protein
MLKVAAEAGEVRLTVATCIDAGFATGILIAGFVFNAVP